MKPRGRDRTNGTAFISITRERGVNVSVYHQHHENERQWSVEKMEGLQASRYACAAHSREKRAQA